MTALGANTRWSLPLLLARNSFFNLVTQVFLMGLGIWAIPIILQGISEERFGLLSLIWAFLGYFGLLDFGISRAATKFVAEARSRSDSYEVDEIISVSIALMIAIGLLSCVIVWVATPFFVSSVFSMKPDMAQDASQVFYLTAIAIPFVLLHGVVRGVQMAYQRFDIVNMLQLAMGVVQWGGSVTVMWLGFGLKELVGLLVATRILVTFAGILMLKYVAPFHIRLNRLWDGAALKKILGFGGWIAVSQLISPLFLYLDRWILGSLVSLSAVGYYSVPQEIVGRLLIIPLSMTLVLFPVFSDAQGDALHQRKGLYYRSTKYLLLMVFPLALCCIALAPEFLGWWVGKDFADHSVGVFQVLALGFIFNALAQMPAMILQAAGFPDVTAKLHLLEIIPTVIVIVFLTMQFGTIGAAFAWTLRAMVDCFLLFIVAHRKIPLLVGELLAGLMTRRVMVQNVALLGVATLAGILVIGPLKILAVAIALVCYCLSLWFFAFDESDRQFFLSIKSRALNLA